MESVPNNLPALITSQGGSLVQVLSWPQHVAVLNRGQIVQIGVIVRRYDGLNTEHAVDLLAEAAGYYGERLDRWFSDKLEEVGLETMMMAIDTLEELGYRSRNTPHGNDRSALSDMLDLLVRLKAIGEEFGAVESLSAFLTRLGGWSIARQLHDDHIAEILSGGLSPADVRLVFDSYEPSDEDHRLARQADRASGIRDDEDDES